jgi:hypothetical protein
MTIVAWPIILLVGIPLWIWLITAFIEPDSLLDLRLRACTGCQRHFVLPGCPVHDPAERRRNGEDLQTTKGTES